MSGFLNIDAQGNCLLGGSLLHPAREPLMAAQKEIIPFLAQAGSFDTLVFMGGGLGWHIKAALSGLSPEQIILYQVHEQEPCWQACLGPELPRLKRVANAQELAEALGARLVYRKEPGRVAVYAPPAYCQAFPQLFQEIKDALARAIKRGQSDHLTRHKLNTVWNQNIAGNIDVLFNVPDIWQSAQSFNDMPALVVGAGPSLDMSLPLLKNMRNKALVLGAASSLGPLARQGLAPHVAVALEAKDETRQFADVDMGKVCLLAALNGNPLHFTRWSGLASFFHSNAWLPALLRHGGPLPTGGHATSAAFTLACLWGCNPIILIGQDLAYTGGRIHAGARPGGEEENTDKSLSVPALDGGQTLTSSVMLSYIEWYEEAAAHLRRQYPHLHIYNATAAGALLKGFANADLKSLLDSLPAIADPEPLVRDLFRGLPRLAPAQVASQVNQARGLLARGFSSYEQLREALAALPLESWFAEECFPENWRQALAGLRLVIDSLVKKVDAC